MPLPIFHLPTPIFADAGGTTQTFLRFNGDWPTPTVLSVAIALALLMFFFYRRELRFHGTAPRWVLPSLRSLAVLLIILCLAGPVLRHEETLRQLGRVLILADASASMSFTDEASAATASSTPSRFERLQQALLHPPHQLLQTLAADHNVELFSLRNGKADRIWWHRNQGKDVSGELPSQIAKPDATMTNLDQPLRDALGPSMTGAAIILLTDGQHNGPGSPEAFAQQLGPLNTPIFTVGYGLEAPPPDLSLANITAPEAVFPGGRAEGILHINDHLAPGLPATAIITAQNKTLWQLNFTTEGSGARQLPFSFPVEELAQLGSNPKDTLRQLNVRIELSGENARKDRITNNNQTTLALHLLTQKRKVLLLDGRPRWETRYLHSHFDRDGRWQITTAFDDFNDGANSSIQQAFPKDEKEMVSYDLVILGDLRPEALKPDQHQLLHDFVEKRGGGLILLDGQRGNLQAWHDTGNSNLIPVSWKPQSDAPPTAFTHDLTTQGQTLAALSLSDSPSTNRTLWEQLPKANWAASAEPLPDASVLSELQSPNARAIPGMVWRRFGAGSVLWLATDEYWRWRYEVADLHHQRFWMQLAAWIAAPPFIVQDDRLSLGMDQLRYRENEQAELRVRLRDANGNIVDKATPRAHLMRNGKQIATLQLEPDPTHGGVFRAVTSHLSSGDYSITVSNDNRPVSDVALRFQVADNTNQEWANLTLNRPLLESMSRSSGGRFLRESDIGQIPELLRQIDRQETRIRETLLWSSWWWFGLIITLLTTEWLLRKHWRLV